MISETTLQKIESLANDVATSAGVQIYDIEFSGTQQGRTLRVFIDKAGTGIGIEDCTNVSRALNEALDLNENLIPGGQYNLEVSSPGLERPLKKLWHFQAAVGKKIWIRLGRALEQFGCADEKLKNAKQLTEILTSVEGEHLHFQFEDQTVVIPWTAVEKAKLVFDFKEGKHEKKGHPSKDAKKSKR